jgi:L-ascorbate metabolism protein UlaG (beta-lactamase superfamily)
VAELPDLDGVLISHEHYDHCDLDAFTYRNKHVPLVVPKTVVEQAKNHGFDNIHSLEPWQSMELGGVTITAISGKHGVYEITYVLQHGPESVYFAGDTMFIPELKELPRRFGHINLALLPTNSLQVRFLNNQQVVMSATEAAELTAILKPDLAIPHHYAFSSGFLGDRMITKKDSDPRHFADAVKRLSPETPVRITQPGTTVEL